MNFPVPTNVEASGSVFNHFRDQYNIHNNPDLFKLLNPINAGHHRSEEVARCEPGTREQLMEIIGRWVGEEGCHQPICWLTGLAGSGKSAVSQTVAELWDRSNILAASFFFQRSDGASNIARLIHTLAYQVSLSVPATKPLIQEILLDDRSIVQQALSHQFKKLLIEPILAAEDVNQAPTTRRVIVIDDLHECDDKESVVQFINILTTYLAKRQLPFRFFLASRAEEHLQKKLGTSAARSIIYTLDLQNFDAGDDIRKFFRSRFATIYEENRELMPEISWPWPSNSDVELLVKRTDGLFHRGVEIVRNVENGRDAPHQNLSAILSANTGPGTGRSFPSPLLFKAFKWPSRSSSQHTSGSGSHVDSLSFSTSSTSLIQLELTTTAERGNWGGSWVPGDARTEPSRINTSGSSVPPYTPECSMSNESPISISQAASEDNPVEATTLEDLIERLILSTIGEPKEFWETFFTTCTAFTTAGKVGQSLIHRFEYADPDPKRAQHRAHLRIHIIKIMQYWVTAPYVQIDIDVLDVMKEFAMSIKSSEVMERLAKELCCAIAERLLSISPSRLDPMISPKVIKLTEARDLAIALLMLGRDKYDRILPADYISYFQQKSGENNIRDAFKTTRNITYWIKQTILNCDHLRDRSKLLEFFIHTAEESRELRNFAFMSAIMTALRDPMITCLKLTYDRLPQDSKHLLQSMEGLLDPHDNYIAYAVMLDGSNNLPCIPFLAPYIAKIRTAFFNAKAGVEVNGITMINFAKWTEFHACIKEVLRHKPPDISKYRQTKARALAYLTGQLRDISPGFTMDQDLERRSSKLRQQEDLDRQQGVKSQRLSILLDG